MRKIIPIAIALMLTGCAGTNLIDTTRADSPIPKGMARLVISRDTSATRFAYGAIVDADNQEIAVLGRGDTVVHDVRAGKVSVDVHASSGGTSTDEITAKPGKTYKFMIKPLLGGSQYSPTAMGVGIMLWEETIKPADSPKAPYFQIVEVQ